MEAPGIFVGTDGSTYNFKEELGRGAYGSVYLVEKNGKYYALKATKFVENRRLAFEQELKAYMAMEKIRGREGGEFLSQFVESVCIRLKTENLIDRVSQLFDLTASVPKKLKYVRGNVGVIVTPALPIDLGKWLQLTKSDSLNPAGYDPYLSWTDQVHVLKDTVDETWEDHIRLFSAQLCLGLQCLHTQIQITHRDLKPANILLKPSRFWTENRTRTTLLSWQPVITDFGTTGHGIEHLTFAGTPSWMAPEVAQNFHSSNREPYTESVDIYSLGATIFSIVTRKAWKFTALKAWYTKDASGRRSDLEKLLKNANIKLTSLLIDVLSGMICEAENRWNITKILDHPWMKMSEGSAEVILLATESLGSLPTRLGRLDASRVSSPIHHYVKQLDDLFEDINSNYTKIVKLFDRWTENLEGDAFLESAARFKRLYVEPWAQYLDYIFVNNIWIIANSYESSDLQYLLGLEVANIACKHVQVQALSAPSFPFWKSFILDFNKTLTILKGNRIEGLYEEEETLVKTLAGGMSSSQVPFPALMHALCVIRYRKLEKQISSKYFNSDPLDDDSAGTSPQQFIPPLIQIKLALHYVILVLSGPPVTISRSHSLKSVALGTPNPAQNVFISSQNTQASNLSNCRSLLADINAAIVTLQKL